MNGNPLVKVASSICLSLLWLFLALYIAYPAEIVKLLGVGAKIDYRWWDNIFSTNKVFIMRGHFAILLIVSLDISIKFIVKKISLHYKALGIAFLLLFMGLICETIIDSIGSYVVLAILGIIIVAMKFISLWEARAIETEPIN